MSGKKKLTKNQYRRSQKKHKKATGETDDESNASEVNGDTATNIEVTAAATSKLIDQDDENDSRVPEEDSQGQDGDSLDVNIDIGIDEGHPLYDQFKSVINRFRGSTNITDDPTVTTHDKGEVFYDDDDNIPDEDEGQVAPTKKRKKRDKMSIAQLKAYAPKPDIVDWTDIDSREPKTLVALKSHRNVVPVPNHWALKREYLSSKRGIEKPPFALPKFIQETGIADQRDAILEKREQASLKQKQRERVQGKLGQMDVDYQKMYEAFFKFQTKPELTRFGEVYYEGKENETNMKHLRPGELSDDLKESLGMPSGYPPPWLIQMQRLGPPPSYPSLRFPGVNAPIPPNCNYGYGAGQWGRPPTDEKNRPVWGGSVYPAYGDQQLAQQGGYQGGDYEEPIPFQQTVLWGELEQREVESEDEEEEEDEDESDEEREDQEMQTEEEEIATGIASIERGGTTSVEPSAYDTENIHGDLNLRKQKHGTESEEPGYRRSAGQVIPEQKACATGFFGSERQYNLSGVQGTENQHVPVLGQEDKSRKRKAGDIDVSVDLDALQRDDKLSKDEVSRQYDAHRDEQSKNRQYKNVDQEDLSEMIAQESRKRLKKDEENRTRRKG